MTDTVRRNAPDHSFWLPFTNMRAYAEAPMRFVAADGVYYTAEDGRQILDGMAGLWCVNAGHAQPKITAAIREAAGKLDFVSSFRMSHPDAHRFARRLIEMAPAGIGHVFFTNSGSESVDSALKIARAYHRARGEPGRTKLIGRQKGYHGMGWGGLSVSGIGRHKRDFGPLLGDVAHLPHPYDPATMRFPRGETANGAHFADALETLAAIHDPATIAAVIVEPVTGSGGVYPPPQGYLRRLREICDRYGILLIFDEVITGFGRLGTNFAADFFGVTPDLMTTAKGLTNGTVPMGAVLITEKVFDGFLDGPPDAIQLFHGYTYSAHPLACAAGLATLDVHAEQDIPGKAAVIAPVLADALHTLDNAPGVTDVRTIGVLGAVELAPKKESPGLRGPEIADRCFAEGVLVRASGDMVVLSPPLTISEAEVGRIAETIGRALRVG